MELNPAGPGGRNNMNMRAASGQAQHVISMRSRWVGKSGRIRPGCLLLGIHPVFDVKAWENA